MRIRIRYFLLFLVISVVIGYLIGWLWPPKFVFYSISDIPVGKGEHLRILISIASSFFTLLAVIVALFKDEILGNFKNVEISVNLSCTTLEESLTESYGDEDPVVSKYFNQVIFHNFGNINALDCELLVERITFKGKDDLHSRPIDFTKKKVLLGGQEKTYIPKNGGHRETNLFEITVSEDPSGDKKTQLLIADNQVPSKAGIWTVEYCLNMSNATIQHYTFEINWDGNWHETKQMMQVETKSK